MLQALAGTWYGTLHVDLIMRNENIEYWENALTMTAIHHSLHGF